MEDSIPVASIDALALPITRFPVPADQNGGGDPPVGSVEVFSVGGTEVGIWELGVGTMYDIEVDEVFVVLAGDAVIEVLDRSGFVTDRTALRPGVVCRLRAGTRTRWSVSRTLRNMYLVESSSAP